MALHAGARVRTRQYQQQPPPPSLMDEYGALEYHVPARPPPPPQPKQSRACPARLGSLLVTHQHVKQWRSTLASRNLKLLDGSVSVNDSNHGQPQPAQTVQLLGHGSFAWVLSAATSSGRYLCVMIVVCVCVVCWLTRHELFTCTSLLH